MDRDLHSLMTAAAKGNHIAFRQLAHELNGVLYAEGSRVLHGNHAAIEDAAQEALIKLWQAAPRWSDDGSGSVAAYARTIMRRCALDSLRTSKRRPGVSLDDDTVGEIAAASAPEGARHDITAAMRHLNPQQRKVATLYYIEGQPQKEIANDLGTTEKAVERMLAYARQKLRAFAGDKNE